MHFKPTNMFWGLALALSLSVAQPAMAQDLFPDGTPIGAWFSDTAKVDVAQLGKQYVVTDYGVRADDASLVQTEKLQAVINKAAADGGGVVVIPKGTFMSGALFFKQGTHLHIVEGGMLKGIDDIAHYPIVKTRMEGQTLNYFSALVNADGLKGFTITGKGTIDGNGQRFWREFWIRRQYNRQCTNLEAMRPRLVYISNCEDVTLCDIRMQNSPFWTTHIYRSQRVKVLGTYTFAPHEPVKAPSSDAFDIDNCKDVLINGCYMSVNDDAVVMKGGKGTWADKDPNNGPNENVIIQNCTYGFVHGCLTLGSESLYNKNIVLRNCNVTKATRVLWLKMRPDTPQNYTYVTIENVKGDCDNFLVVKPWTQFFKPEEREDMPLSKCSFITLKDIDMDCGTFYAVSPSDKYALDNFTFSNCNVRSKDATFDLSFVKNGRAKNVTINGKKVK